MSPYICNICHKSFNSNQHLKQHKNKKNPCYNVSVKQTEIDPNIAISIQNTYMSDFIVNYQTLVKERELTNKLIEEYKTQKTELLRENKILKKKLKAISQIIHNSNKDDDTVNYDYDDNSCVDSNASTTSYISGIPDKFISPLNARNVFKLPSPITLFTSDKLFSSNLQDKNSDFDENSYLHENNYFDENISSIETDIADSSNKSDIND